MAKPEDIEEVTLLSESPPFLFSSQEEARVRSRHL